jgi:hypothetical protein
MLAVAAVVKMAMSAGRAGLHIPIDLLDEIHELPDALPPRVAVRNDSEDENAPPERALLQADEGTRTLDLLHGKQTL